MKNRKPRLCKKSSVEAQHPQLSLSGRDNLRAHCTPLSYPNGSSRLYWAGWPMVGFATFVASGDLSRLKCGDPQLRSVQPPTTCCPQRARVETNSHNLSHRCQPAVNYIFNLNPKSDSVPQGICLPLDTIGWCRLGAQHRPQAYGRQK